jgi:hypothetical protein
MSLHYFELPKLPKTVSAEDSQKLWLALFRAETEEELKRIEALGGSDMEQAIGAYRHITTTDEFRELERLRTLARHNEAAALGNARREATAIADAKWQGVVADKDSENARLREQLAELQSQLGKDK